MVNDGSIDDTEKIIRKYAYKIIDSKTGLASHKKQIQPLPITKNIILVNRKIGGLGKADVLNDAKKYAQGELIFAIDADIGLRKDSLLKAVKHFADPRVGAVIGYFTIVDRGHALSGFINFEFAVGQRIQRIGYDTLGIHYIIPGACGVFRKDLFKILGDYTNDTLAEDTDMTFKLLTKTNTKIHYDPSVHVDVDEPNQLWSLWKQRIRWYRGNLEVTRKHYRNFGHPKYGKAFTIGIPFWLAQMILPLGFTASAAAFLTANLLEISMGPFLGFSKVIAIFFFAAIAYIIVKNKGKYALHGIMSAGIPMLFTMTTALLFADGIFDFMTLIGYPEYTGTVVWVLLLWIVSPLGLTYLVVQMSKKHPNMAEFLQLIVLGYWSLLIAAGVYSYFKELKGDEQVWTRTDR